MIQFSERIFIHLWESLSVIILLLLCIFISILFDFMSVCYFPPFFAVYVISSLLFSYWWIGDMPSLLLYYVISHIQVILSWYFKRKLKHQLWLVKYDGPTLLNHFVYGKHRSQVPFLDFVFPSKSTNALFAGYAAK